MWKLESGSNTVPIEKGTETLSGSRARFRSAGACWASPLEGEDVNAPLPKQVDLDPHC
jgi:hypothetical protein